MLHRVFYLSRSNYAATVVWFYLQDLSKLSISLSREFLEFLIKPRERNSPITCPNNKNLINERISLYEILHFIRLFFNKKINTKARSWL